MLKELWVLKEKNTYFQEQSGFSISEKSFIIFSDDMSGCIDLYATV